MTSENKALLLTLAQWAASNERKLVSKVRELARTEDNYRIFIREYDRVQAQLVRARCLQINATLTIRDWLITLDHFNWRCAYCQIRPFQILHHFVPLPEGGTTADNCVRACYSCRRPSINECTHVQRYLAERQDLVCLS